MMTTDNRQEKRVIDHDTVELQKGGFISRRVLKGF
jgi:hypothetical protein